MHGVVFFINAFRQCELKSQKMCSTRDYVTLEFTWLSSLLWQYTRSKWFHMPYVHKIYKNVPTICINISTWFIYFCHGCSQSILRYFWHCTAHARITAYSNEQWTHHDHGWTEDSIIGSWSIVFKYSIFNAEIGKLIYPTISWHTGNAQGMFYFAIIFVLVWFL